MFFDSRIYSVPGTQGANLEINRGFGNLGF
jgi:hypothetical protein